MNQYCHWGLRTVVAVRVILLTYILSMIFLKMSNLQQIMKFKYPDDNTKGVWVGGKTSSADTWSSYEFYDGTNMGTSCSQTECGEHSEFDTIYEKIIKGYNLQILPLRKCYLFYVPRQLCSATIVARFERCRPNNNVYKWKRKILL